MDPYIYYTMDSVTGSTLNDEEGNLNGSITGATQVDGRIGKALDFSGTSTEVKCTPHPGLTNDIAISFYCKFDSIGTETYLPVVTLSNNSASTGIGLIKTYGAARIHMAISGNYSTGGMNAFAYNNATYGHSPNTDTWYHYFCQYNHNSSKYEFWVDGVAIFTENPATFGSLNTRCNGISIGYGLNAQIDNVKIFNLSASSPFTESEIEALRDEWSVYNGYFSGYVYENTTAISGSQLYLYNRSDGSLIGSTTSSGDGYFYITTTSTGSHFLVCLDTAGGNVYNDLIYGDMYPVTISG